MAEPALRSPSLCPTGARMVKPMMRRSGVFAGEVGTPRLLKLFDKFKIKASWFIPGHSIETFPEQTKMIAAAGHEIGAHGYLPPMMFIKKAPNSHGFVNPRQIEEMWRDEFDWVYREMDYGIFPITIHPDVSGRPQVLLMLERLIGHINAHSGVRWLTMEEIAEDFRRRQPFKAY
jgi:peptidoglycan/xylan/chitin deacetylase (PgdA/CDA1 family)